MSDGLPSVLFSQLNGVWENTKTIVSAGYFASATLRINPQTIVSFEAVIEGRMAVFIPTAAPLQITT